MPDFNRDISQSDIRWLPRAEQHADDEGLDRRVILAAARYPDHTTIDPSCRLLESRYYAERRRKGDVTVVVAFPPGETPIIWGAYYNLPLAHSKRRATGGGGGGTTVPTTMREFRRRIIEAGLVIKSGGRHDRVETPDGSFVFSLSVSPSDHRWMQNAVRELARKGYDVTR